MAHGRHADCADFDRIAGIPRRRPLPFERPDPPVALAAQHGPTAVAAPRPAEPGAYGGSTRRSGIRANSTPCPTALREGEARSVAQIPDGPR